MPHISARVRFRIMARDSFTCIYCGAKPPDIALEIDRRLPSSIGGGDNDENLVTACGKCNRGKSDGIIGENGVTFPKKPDPKWNGEYLHAARESRGQSQPDVAYALGCATNTVWRWENGKAIPRGYFRRQLEAAYPELRG